MAGLPLKLIFFLTLCFAAASPVILSMKQANQKSDSASKESRAAAGVDIFPSGQGNENELFASEQWKRSVTEGTANELLASEKWKRSVTPTRVQESRDSEATIFNHVQWEGRDLDNTAARSTTQLFAHAQWEEMRQVSNDRKDSQADLNESRDQNNAKRDHEAHVSSAEADFFEDEPWERREEPPELEDTKRKDAPTGPIFFAKVQWDE
ncbi:hypothetical protein FB451DRAFT_1276380 [Mycena latifolia]|nr:hypothetical protein FB451DRAFT_1276380 [Mycena latifolia]